MPSFFLFDPILEAWAEINLVKMRKRKFAFEIYWPLAGRPAFDKPIWRYHQTSYVCLFWQMGQHCQHIIPIFLQWWPSCQRLLLLRTLWRKVYAILELQDTQLCVNYELCLNFGSKTTILFPSSSIGGHLVNVFYSYAHCDAKITQFWSYKIRIYANLRQLWSVS